MLKYDICLTVSFGEGCLERACLWLCLKTLTSGVESGWMSLEREIITIGAGFLGMYLNSDPLLPAPPFPWLHLVVRTMTQAATGLVTIHMSLSEYVFFDNIL